MNDSNNQNSPIRRYLGIARFSAPVIIFFMVNYVQILTDQVFIGHYKTESLVAINNAAFPFFMVANICFAAGNALSILVAKNLGAKNVATAKSLVETSYLGSLIITVPLFLLFFFGGDSILHALGSKGEIHHQASSYLSILCFNFLIFSVSITTSGAFQGMGQNLLNLVGESIRVGLNVFLNWLLIFGNLNFPEMGIQGAALATVISSLTGAIVNTFLLFAHKKELVLSIQQLLKPKISLGKDIVRLGIPMAFEFTMANFIPIMIIYFLNKENPIYVGVFGIWNTLIWFAHYFSIGIGITGFSIIGKAIGAKSYHEARLTTQSMQFYGQTWCLLIAALFIIFPTEILGFFSKDPVVIQYGNHMGLLALILFPKAFGVLSAYGLKCYGDTISPLMVQLLGLVIIPVGMYLFLTHLQWGIKAALIAWFLDEAIKSIINFGILERLARKKTQLIKCSEPPIEKRS